MINWPTADGPSADPLGILGNIDRIPECRHTQCKHARRARIRSPCHTPSEVSSDGGHSDNDSHSTHSEHSERSEHSARSDQFEDVRAALNTVEEQAVKPEFTFGGWPSAATEQPPPCVDKVPRPKSLFRRQAKA